MSSLVATVKPKSCPDWSSYLRIELTDQKRDPDSGADGSWRVIATTMHTEHKGGDWVHIPDSGAILLLVDKYGENEVGLVFSRVHWNFRVVYSHTQCTGPGLAPLAAAGNQDLVWVMGPGIVVRQPSRHVDPTDGLNVADGTRSPAVAGPSLMAWIGKQSIQ